MSEIQMTGSAGENKQGVELQWGLDGWTNETMFELVITSPYNEGIASLDRNQCSMLLATLVEHIKEVKDADEENSR
jgi:hypothetical protein